MPHRAPGSPGHKITNYLSGKAIKYYRPRGSADIRQLVDGGFQAFNAGRLSEACHIFTEKMLDPANDTTIGLTVAGALTPAGLGGCVIELMDRGLVDFMISTGANLYHEITTDQVVWGGLSGATPAEAVSWGKVNPGVLPHTVVAYCDSTIAFPLFCEYVVGSTHNRRPRKELVHRRDELVADLLRQARQSRDTQSAAMTAQPAEVDRHR